MNSESVKRFSKNFIINGVEVTVDFHPVNIAVKQLYQIYTPIDGKPFRIHMQKDPTGKFKIAIKDRVPGWLQEMEALFEQAILDS